MTQSSTEDLAESTYTVLEARASFANLGSNTRDRYLLSEVAIESLAWLATSIVLPILTGIAGNAFTGIIRKRLFRRKPVDPSELRLGVTPSINASVAARLLQNPELLKEDTRRIHSQYDPKTRPGQDRVQIAEVTLAEVLKINGWPNAYATEDAHQIVFKIRNQLWVPEER